MRKSLRVSYDRGSWNVSYVRDSLVWMWSCWKDVLMLRARALCDSSSMVHSVQLFVGVFHKTLCNQPMQVEVNSNLSMLSSPSTLSPMWGKLPWYVWVLQNLWEHIFLLVTMKTESLNPWDREGQPFSRFPTPRTFPSQVPLETMQPGFLAFPYPWC